MWSTYASAILTKHLGPGDHPNGTPQSIHGAYHRVQPMRSNSPIRGNVFKKLFRTSPATAREAHAELGEQLAAKHFREAGWEVHDLNTTDKFFPADIFIRKGDKAYVIEVKTSDADVSDKRWRVQPGGKQYAQTKNLSPEEKKRWRSEAVRATIIGKLNVLQDIQKRYGEHVEPATLGILVDYRKWNSQLHFFGGYHESIPHPKADARSIGSFVGDVPLTQGDFISAIRGIEQRRGVRYSFGRSATVVTPVRKSIEYDRAISEFDQKLTIYLSEWKAKLIRAIE